MIDFSRVPLYALLSLVCAAAPGQARDCGPDAPGVSRTLTIGPKGTAVGLQSYPRTLDLQDHEVVLTFDDGPAGPTAKVLDALAAECARATFFVIGRNAESAPALVRRTADEGHSIGHHSYSHPGNTLRLMDDAAAREDIEKGIKAVEKASGGKAAPFFRFPGFADTPSLVAYLEGKGYTIFGSDLWASDWSPMSPKGELDLVMKRLEKEGKGIVLFHDSKAQTAAMVPDFLRELKTRGYKLVHIVPGDGETPVVAAGPGWTSTTEPIIAKTLAGKRAAPGHSHAGDAGDEDKSPPPANQ
ncbi:polysaccharide deacetylase family protein [Methylocystis parvus]|uniref:Chitooligosaccharide deacetylase n=1 Tax=Methylocystis parvus TaxID=134 RepID=A0A6B8M1I3_9HYPH|nr:polysaccharide deacetylase family protein [Methylocystis parvus]QGM96155.1 polysaccharide deacetylase family protein [Methylocystis parvus]WBK00021.1 polysaccharide deacetylase family protein [Methylocystis parvus OBBP]